MAGIGFELRRLLRSQSFAGQLRAYAYAGIISSGPWLLSIAGIMLIGLWGAAGTGGREAVVAFQVSVTYLIAGSLVLTGPLQIMFTRYTSDRLFEERRDAITPDLLGALLLTTVASGTLSVLVLGLLFREPLLYRALMAASFVTLCDIWIVVLFLSGLKAYRQVLFAFAVGYGIAVVAALGLRSFGLSGLLSGFLIGHAVLLFGLLALVLRAYPGRGLVSFGFLRRDQIFPGLAVTGFLYNLAIWVDKILFWFDPELSSTVIGPLRASLIYDVPIFLAYLAIIPGMAVFLVRIETDFAEHHHAFYAAVREGGTLGEINRAREAMINAVRQGIYEIFKIQGLTMALLVIGGPSLLRVLGISPSYIHLLYVDTAAVSVQVLLLAILNVLFYLDQRQIAQNLSLLFVVSNIGLTLLSQRFGPSFYGYGFACSVVLTSLIGLAALSRKLERLEYETFMLQPC